MSRRQVQNFTIFQKKCQSYWIHYYIWIPRIKARLCLYTIYHMADERKMAGQIFSNIIQLNHYYLNHHIGKCIQIGTNMSCVGVVLCEIVLTFWEFWKCKNTFKWPRDHKTVVKMRHVVATVAYCHEAITPC